MVVRTLLEPIEVAPVFEMVISPDIATEAAWFDPLPTSMLPDVRAASLVKSIAAEELMSLLVIVESRIMVEVTLPEPIEVAPRVPPTSPERGMVLVASQVGIPPERARVKPLVVAGSRT